MRLVLIRFCGGLLPLAAPPRADTFPLGSDSGVILPLGSDNGGILPLGVDSGVTLPLGTDGVPLGECITPLGTPRGAGEVLLLAFGNVA